MANVKISRTIAWNRIEILHEEKTFLRDEAGS